MSFHFVRTGSVDQVREQVADVDVYNNKVGDLVKQFVSDVLDLQGSVTGVHVEASGHSGAEPGGVVSVNVHVRATGV